MRRPACARPRRLAGLLRAREGAVAIEAALVIPFLLLAVVTLIDTVRYIDTSARMGRVAATTADLITRGEKLIARTDFTSPGADELGMYLLIANKVAAPSDLVGRGRVYVTSVTPLASGFKQNWAPQTGAYGLAVASRIGELPALPVGGAMIVVEVFYRFDPLILDTLGVLGGDGLTIYRRAVFRPRLGTLETLGSPS